MCLAVPGELIEIEGETSLARRGKVDFGGIKREVNLMFVPEAKVGDYVMVHVGFALAKVDEEEANKVFQYLETLKDGEPVEEKDR